MKVFLAGASGFVGGHLLRRLSDAGHEVVAFARPGPIADRLEAERLPGCRVLRGDVRSPESWRPHLAGCDGVVNAVGIIRETRPGDFEALHERFAIDLFDAAIAAGARRLVQISALGADDGAATRYHLTKRAADRHVVGLPAAVLVLRPSLIYGPGDQSLTFFRSLAAQPVILLPGAGESRLQPVHVDDVVSAAAEFLARRDDARLTLDLGGPEAIAFRDLVRVLARNAGEKCPWEIPVPWPVMELVAGSVDRLGAGPITTEELSMLRRGNTGDLAPFRAAFGREPLPLEVGLARTPFPHEFRMAARLRPWQGVLRCGIASVWLLTGLICATGGRAACLSWLARLGIGGLPADGILYGTCLLEVLLGLALLAGLHVRRLCDLQLAMMLFFTLTLTVVGPDLWLDPFGSLTKNLPLAAAVLVLRAWEEPPGNS